MQTVSMFYAEYMLKRCLGCTGSNTLLQLILPVFTFCCGCWSADLPRWPALSGGAELALPSGLRGDHGADSLLLPRQQAGVHLAPAGRWPKEQPLQPMPDGPGQRAAPEQSPRRPLRPERALV